MRRVLSALVIVCAFVACNATPPAAPAADWNIDIDGSAAAGRLKPSLLGQYDLSGALFNYDQYAGLPASMKLAGLSDWRVGVGRWEFGTRLLPTLSDGTSCASDLAVLPPAAQAPAGSTDLDLIASRDWIDAKGNYSLTYLDSVLNVVKAFGANPYIDIDLMPRALAVNQTPSRVPIPPYDACNVSFTNKVSNVRPADAAAFASAAVGLVQRTVEGAHPEALTWELWNEPELAYAWDPSFESTPGKIDQFFNMALTTLQALNQYRASSSNAQAKMLRFGFGSFAFAATAKTVIEQFDAAPAPPALDLVSFHSYSNDPLKIADDVSQVVAARAASAHYRNIELVLSEWGPDLTTPLSGQSMDPSLIAATVVALSGTLGLDRAMHTFFYDFYPQVPFGLIDNSLKPKPLYSVYLFLNQLIGNGADRLSARGFEDGRLDGGMGAVLIGRDSGGVITVLIVNRNSQARTFNISLNGQAAKPRNIFVLDDPTEMMHPATDSVAPARSVVLLQL